MSIDLSNVLKQNLGLEDNSQVEVNFHIDTDEDNAPDVAGDAPEVEENLEVPEPNQTNLEAEEATADAAESSDEAEQLQEAQDSLESLTAVMSKHIDNGTMSRMGLRTYRLALESIVPAKVLDQVGITSLESNINTSKYHASVMAQAELAEVSNVMNTVSMEASMDWLKKTRHKIAVFFKREKELEKRARALLALAKTSEGEHANRENLKLNAGKKTPTLKHITTLNWSHEKEFQEHVEHFCNLYNSMAGVKKGYDDEFTDNIFPESRKWPKDADGNPVYKTFRIKLVRKNNLVNGHSFPMNTDEVTVPNLTPAACQKVLETLIETLAKGKIMNDNIGIMLDVLGAVVKYDAGIGVGPNGSLATVISERYPEGYEEMYETLEKLKELRIKVTSDILNYVNHCLNDRDFV